MGGAGAGSPVGAREGVPNLSVQCPVPLVSPSPGPVLQFLAPSSVEEPVVRSEGHSQPDPAPREPVEVYPEAGTWELVLAGVGTALLTGGVLLLLVTVSAGCWRDRCPLQKCGFSRAGTPFFLMVEGQAVPALSRTRRW